VDIFGPHKSVKDFLDCTQSTKTIGEMLKNGGCTWLPSTESFTAKHRPAGKTQLESGELVITRHREDVELRTNCHAVRITFVKKLPFAVPGTHEVDAESFADAERITDLIKLHREVIIERYRQITVVYHGVTHPGSKCEVPYMRSSVIRLPLRLNGHFLLCDTPLPTGGRSNLPGPVSNGVDSGARR